MIPMWHKYDTDTTWGTLNEVFVCILTIDMTCYNWQIIKVVQVIDPYENDVILIITYHH